MKKFNNNSKANTLKRFKLHQGGAIVVELAVSVMIFLTIVAFMAELAYIRNLQARADSAAYRLLDMLRTDALWTYTDHNDIVHYNQQTNQEVDYECHEKDDARCGRITGTNNNQSTNQDTLQRLLLGQKRNFRPLTDQTIQTLYSALSYLMQVDFNKKEGHDAVQMVIERYEDVTCSSFIQHSTNLDPGCDREDYNSPLSSNTNVEHIFHKTKTKTNDNSSVTHEYTYRRYSGLAPGSSDNTWVNIQNAKALTASNFALRFNREKPTGNDISGLNGIKQEAKYREQYYKELAQSKGVKINDVIIVPTSGFDDTRKNGRKTLGIWNRFKAKNTNVTCAPKKYLNDPAFQVLSVVDSQSTGTARKLPMYQVTLCVNAKGLFSRLITGKDGDYSFRTSAFGVARQTL